MSWLSFLAKPFRPSFWRRDRPDEPLSATAHPGALALPMPPPPPSAVVFSSAQGPGRAELASRRRRRSDDEPALAPFQPLRVPAWEVAQVAQALDMHEAGDFSWSAPMFESMRRDPAIEPAFKKRIDSLFGADFGFEPSGEAPDKLGERIAQDARDAWTRCHPEPVLRRLQRYGLGVGVAPCQVLSDREWEYSLEVWDPQYLRYNWADRRYEVYTSEGLVPCEGPRWQVYAPDGCEGWNSGLLRCLAVVWLIHTFAWRDWARFSERHGQPVIGVKFPHEGFDVEVRERFLAEMRQFGRSAVVALPQIDKDFGTALELIEAKDQSWEGFERLIATCRMMAQIALLGGNLTSEVRGGSLAAAQEHGDEKRLLLRSDAQSLSTFLRGAVWEPRTWARYGRREYAPWPRWDTDPPADVEAEGDAVQAIVKAVGDADERGIDLDLKAMCDRYDLPLRERGKGDDAFAHLPPGRRPRRLAQHHLTYGLVTLNEARADLGLPLWKGPEGEKLLPIMVKGIVRPGEAPPPDAAQRDADGDGEVGEGADDVGEAPADDEAA